MGQKSIQTPARIETRTTYPFSEKDENLQARVHASRLLDNMLDHGEEGQRSVVGPRLLLPTAVHPLEGKLHF